MSNKTTILEGPDGRLYEIPDSDLARFAVPGEKVAQLRKERLAPSDAHASHMPPGHIRPGQAPAGFPPPPDLSQPNGAAAPNGAGASLSLGGGAGGAGMTLNFFFGGPPPPGLAAGVIALGNAAPPAQASGVEGYHMTFDENGIPTNHAEMLWGDYIDKQGNPAVGWHSHDPVTGNAQ